MKPPKETDTIKKPDSIKIIPFSSEKYSEKAKKSDMERKKNHLLPIGAHREKKNHDQIPREIEYGTLFGPISSLLLVFLFADKKRHLPQDGTAVRFSKKKLNR